MPFHLPRFCRRASGLLFALGSLLFVAAGAPGFASILQHPIGFDLTLPAGWMAMPGEGGQFVLLPGDLGDSEVVLLLAGPADGVRSTVDPETIRRTEHEVRQNYPMLARVGEPLVVRTALGDGVLLVFEGAPPGELPIRLSLHALVVEETLISVLAVGARQQVAPRATDLNTIFASLSPGGQETTLPPKNLGASPSTSSPAHTAPHIAGELHDNSPLAREWAQRLAGRKLTVLSGYSSGGSSGGFNSRHDLTLFANGRFYLYGSSSVSIAVEGLGGSSVSEEEESGIWRVASRGQTAILELTTDRGERQGGELTRSGSNVFLNGTRVLITTP